MPPTQIIWPRRGRLRGPERASQDGKPLFALAEGGAVNIEIVPARDEDLPIRIQRSASGGRLFETIPKAITMKKRNAILAGEMWT